MSRVTCKAGGCTQPARARRMHLVSAEGQQMHDTQILCDRHWDWLNEQMLREGT